MKKLRITVNQKVFDVVVQVLEDDEQTVTGAGFMNPLPPPPKSAATPIAAPAPPAAPPASSAIPTMPSGAPLKGDPNAILAPLAGVVQKVYVQAGGTVDAKAPVVLLDAMKMDTYIYAPRAGKVAEVSVAPGDAVQVGDRLIRYEVEG
ncbi:MAG TPA: biotin/lipoyl-containing protein [Vicinamibacterales bacterium]|nr:biotin/lipoyl-containing protein [Vicinamibacterales bacterium]